MKNLTSLLLIVIVAVLFCCTGKTKQADIQYPNPLPDSIALTYLPKLVSSDSFDFNACFSPDGNSYYFTCKESGKTLIYQITHDGTNWTSPKLTSFTDTAWSQADPAFTPDGKLYFISNRPKDLNDTLRDFDIWVTSPIENNGWSAPENFSIVNSDSNEYYISFTKTGDLFLGSSRLGGYGQEDIYVSEFVNNQYTSPHNLGPHVNSDKSEFDPFISSDGTFVIFASSKHDDSLGGTDLYVSKFEKGEWTKAINLGNKINTSTRDFCPYISPDGKYFFFSSNADVKWIGVDVLNPLTKTK